MKLSELSTDKSLDVLCEITPSIANIVEDDAVIRALGDILPQQQDEKQDGGEDAAKQDYFAVGIRMMGKIVRLAPMLLKSHRADVYNILAVLNEKTAQELSEQPIPETIRQIREMFQDGDLLAFFRSFVPRARTEPSAPSASSPASE